MFVKTVIHELGFPYTARCHEDNICSIGKALKKAFGFLFPIAE